MTASVNDFCIGQNHMDKANIAEIIGHLIDKVRGPLAVNLCFIYIGLAQFFGHLWG